MVFNGVFFCGSPPSTVGSLGLELGITHAGPRPARPGASLVVGRLGGWLAVHGQDKDILQPSKNRKRTFPFTHNPTRKWAKMAKRGVEFSRKDKTKKKLREKEAKGNRVTIIICIANVKVAKSESDVRQAPGAASDFFLRI